MSEQKELNNAASTSFDFALQQGISSDWAIAKSEYPEVRRNFSQLKSFNVDFKALEFWRSESLSNTYSVKIRDGVAIIPVTGPIFRYLNWYMYYFGGTAMTLLARDFQAAFDNPNVYSILFEINSPGGEVTGINEFCKTLFAARSKKPMTARVGGLGCSAAYWIASACGDIAIDETSQLGSIGVQTVYFDDTKYLEMNGFEEIVLTSDISPNKNLPPTDDAGRTLVNHRLNVLAKVFAGNVGIYRDIPLKTVLRDFGKGDVIIGQEAIDAGLADRFASFEEALTQLANAHTPELIRQQDSRATFNLQTDVVLLSASEGAVAKALEDEKIQNDQINISEEIMEPENKQPENSANNSPAAGAPAATETAEFEQMKAELAASKEREAAMTKQLAAQSALTDEAKRDAEKTKLNAELTETAKTFAGNQAEKSFVYGRTQRQVRQGFGGTEKLYRRSKRARRAG